MRFILPALILLFCHGAEAQNHDSAQVKRIYDYFLTRSSTYANLEHLATRIGGRLSGSPQAAQAVEWARQAMKAAGADTVYLQPCMVPQWVRGEKEKCTLQTGGRTVYLACTSLGSSAGTGPKGLTAQVVEVRSFAHLDSIGEAVKGKIVFYNVFFDRTRVNTGSAYGEAVVHRGRGASHAAKYGAVACLVRSMTSLPDDEPHTGNMSYDTTVSKVRIPALALGFRSADLLHNSLTKDKKLSLTIRNTCQMLKPVLSYNVVGEIRGSMLPGQIILAGGHLDSWDNGQGAHDDGAGVVQSIEMLAAFRALGERPLHTIRAVAFMNEENGLAGGNAYAKAALEKGEVHVTAIESDAGGFTPRGFAVDTLNGLFKAVSSWKHIFAPYFVDHFVKEGGGADLIALEKLGVPCIGFIPDPQRYFDIHHTAADTFDKVHRRELELGGAAISSLVYLVDRHFKPVANN
jgi:carboxypeptidase Q